MAKKRQSPNQASKLDPIHPNAAGIDIGAQNHWVCVPSGRANECVRRFGCYTADLYAIADWLTESGVETVAMESTGVYWIPLFQILETRGFEVKLVNAHHSKIKSSQTRPVVNRAANAFRMAAQTAGKSHSALGAFYRRLRSRLGSPKAITATAHKIARIFYKLWTYRGDYTDPGMDYYEQRYRERMVNNLHKKAQAFGFELIPQPSENLVS